MTTATSLPCSISDSDLINEPCSIRCDAVSCEELFHPSCLGNSAPLDTESWFGQDCQSTEPIIDHLDSSNFDDSATVRAIREARLQSDLQDQLSHEDVPMLLCAICDGDLQSEPTSIRCDSDGCKYLFHRSCLGDTGPIDTEKWYCRRCQQQLDSSNKGECDICLCQRRVVEEDSVFCDSCRRWYHPECLKISHKAFQRLQKSEDEYCCPSCTEAKSNKHRISWANIDGLENIMAKIIAVHQELTKWKPNIFLVPKGKVGKAFLAELNRLFQLFNNKSVYEPIALHLIQIFIPLMLQKPSAKSKNRDHVKYLDKRLVWWNEFQLQALIDEGKAIQKNLLQLNESKRPSELKAFTRLMLQGKLKKALKFVDEDDSIVGVHEPTSEIIAELERKHPKQGPVDESVILPEQNILVQPVIFERINADAIIRSAQNIHGSGGPSRIDADTWKNMICSKAHGSESMQLAEEIAVLTRRLCAEAIPFDYVRTLMSCRLVPLKKSDNSVRPVGIGETLRRIISKSVVSLLKPDILSASGCLQTCAGLEGGIEAAVHAMRHIYEDDKCEAIILIDAENAFNRLNRKVALRNIKQICPNLYQFLDNSYRNPVELFLEDGSHILSEEGVTQGDPAAMAKYALASKPLIVKLSDGNPEVKQVWYADDGTGAGKIAHLRPYWDNLCKNGPAYGYFPKASKSVLIVKDPSLMEQAETTFAGVDIEITCDGQRHLGAAIGTLVFREKFVKSKVEKWAKDVNKLAVFAEAEPQAALAAFVKGISCRWQYLQRTVPNIAEYFRPLEDAIRHQLIPALIGREVSDTERRIFALPYRYGGLAIRNPIATADEEFQASLLITAELTKAIVNQEDDVSSINHVAVQQAKDSFRKNKEENMKQNLENICKLLPGDQSKYLLSATEKGASSWLAVLPLKNLGYSLNKREFQDAICLRYGWTIPDMPKHCGCGKKNSVDHSLNCHLGGYVHLRHNKIRDTEAKIMKEVAFDVKIEPGLAKVSKHVKLAPGTNIEDNARSDVSARGIFSSHEVTFFDVRISNPNASSYKSLSLAEVYKKNEIEKMKSYSDRILQVEKGSFVPLVYTTTGGMGPQCAKTHKRIAELVALKKNERYSEVINHIRTRLRFSLLKCVLIAIRGARGKGSRSWQEDTLSNISFNLIPYVKTYEG